MLGIIFNTFKVKYSKLDDMMSRHCKDINHQSKINLFINIEPILKKLANSSVDEYLKIKTEEKTYELISNIVNLAAHYRLFFTKNKLYSRIYFYMGYPFDSYYKNKEINPSYRNNYAHKYTKDDRYFVLSNTLQNVIGFTKIILEYIEGVYLITSDFIEPSLVPKVIIDHNKDNYVNFILSSDRYDYQYVNYDFRIIRPKQLDSYIVSKENVIDILRIEEKVLTETDIQANFYPFILSLLGDKNRNIDKIKGVGLARLIQMINKAIETNLISPNASNITSFEAIIKEEFVPLLKHNFMCVNLETQFMRLNIRSKHDIAAQLVDKFDNASLKNLNDQFFRYYPMYLMELTSANKLIKIGAAKIFK